MLTYEQILEQANLRTSFLLETRRFLHRNPEVSWKEYRTSAYLRALLEQNGLKPSEPMAGGTGFFVDIGPDSDQRIAWRADIDALPIQDKKTTSYTSAVDGVGHLCGHDVHSTIALGIAIQLNQQNTGKSFRIFFQPAEESSPSGAPRMIEDGVLNGVSHVLALHCDPNQKAGNISMNPGPETASYDGIHLTLKSDFTNHSARPHTGKDLIWIANLMLTEWYGIVGRITDTRDPSILTISTIHAGEAINVMPDHLKLTGTLRCVSEEARKTLKEFLVKSAKQMELVHGIQAELIFDDGSPAVINHPDLVTKAKSILSSIVTFEQTRQSMGAEDFAWYTYQVPALFIRMGTKSSSDTGYALHHNCFDIDETVIPLTVARMSYLLTNLS